jgi:hypothetical protein
LQEIPLILFIYTGDMAQGVGGWGRSNYSSLNRYVCVSFRRTKAAFRDAFLKGEMEMVPLSVAVEKLHRVDMAVFQGSMRTWMYRGS